MEKISMEGTFLQKLRKNFQGKGI